MTTGAMLDSIFTVQLAGLVQLDSVAQLGT
jgi:hypothetical protein